ncbi:MFS transporter [Actinomadura kijaniata]|uniref:MFS transporter n=1 Tax=Actinomadura kijaniata TaxID=46161 RepID=UPI003F1DD225
MTAVHGAAAGPVLPVPGADDRPAAPARLVAALVAAQFGAYMAILTPVIVTLAVRVAQVAPGTRAASLGQVLSVGAVLALVANPLFGALSDRTTSRFGRRRPWLLGGMVVGLAGLLLVAVGGTVPLLTLGWAVAQLGVNATLAALTAIIPDQIPDRQRARVSGLVGMMTSVAMVGGAFVAQAVAGDALLMMAVPGVVGLLCVGWLVLVLRDAPADRAALAPYGPRTFLRSFWVNPLRHRDFGWNWLGRFMVYVGLASLTSYQTYYLVDRLGFTTEQAAGKVFLSTLVMTAATVVGSILGGTLSDRSGRRKPYVVFSAAVTGLALLTVALVDSLPLFLCAVALFGFGQGLYMAVDVALAAAVLPDPRESAKDMGVLNIANALPQSLVPIVAPALLALGGGDGQGGNYSALFVTGAVCGLLGAFAVQLVRSVR